MSFETKCEELTEMVSLPTWFTVDTKTGSIAVHLDFPQCFSAEVYAGDAGMDAPPEDEETQSMFCARRLRVAGALRTDLRNTSAAKRLSLGGSVS